MAKKLTSAKAKKILHDKEVHGKPLTEKQRKFFGAIAGGAEPYKAQNGIEGTMGGLTDIGFNYNGAWNGPSMQMGGSLPGAVGFMYARTQSPAPSNGPYAKKTKASAQNGMEMSYYQHGLDFKPKTISQDGIAIDPMGYWNPENVGGPVIIPSTDITMQGVDQPLIGISNTGDTQYMEPGNNYMFDGDYVTEYPMAQAGKRVPITVSDPKDPRLKAYQDSLALYNFYEKSYRQRKKENNVEKESRFKNFIGLNQTNQPDNMAQYYSNKKSTLFKKNEIHPIIEYSYKEDSPEIFIDDVYYPARKNVEKFGFRFKKPVQPVEYRKPEPKQEVVKKPEPVVEKKAPPTDYFQGTSVFAPTPYHGSGAGAFVGYRTPQGDTVFVKPEDYERMGVPKYGREFIESKTKKMKNGGVSVNNADAQPIEKLDQLLNFTNYNDMAKAKHGKTHKKAQVGKELPRIQLPKIPGTWEGLTPPISSTPTATANKFNPAKAIPVLGQIIGGIQNIKAQKEKYREAKQQTALTDVMAQAAASKPVQQPRRQYVRPEDMIFQPEQMSPSYGVGTNVLAQDGAMIGGTPTEIQNMYNPGTIYTDLGYEPLNDSSKMKQFAGGGFLESVKSLNNSPLGQTLGSAEASQLANIMGGGQTGGWSNILGGVGGLAGGPIGFMANFIGSAIDKQLEKKIENQQELTGQNIGNIIGQSTGMSLQNRFGAMLQDGGTTSPYKWVSHTWQPRTITQFGEYKMKDLLKPPVDADMLRAGGHLKEYTPPSERAMSTERPDMQMGGELQTHWGGYAETMSENPYLPDGGEMIMFRGQSHDESDGKGNTGIGITYGDNPVEVERGEPAVKLRDGGTGDTNLTVFGNINLTKGFANLLGKPEVAGQKIKNYAKDLGMKQNKENKKIEKAVDELENLDVQNQFDLLKMNSLSATINGGNQKLKMYGEDVQDLAALQNAIHSTRDEEELIKVTDKGDVKSAKKGANIPKAQRGFSQGRANAYARTKAAATTAAAPTLSDDLPIVTSRPGTVNTSDYNYLTRLYNEAKAQGTGEKVELFQKEFSRIAPDLALQVLSEYDVTSFGKTKGFPKTDVRSNIDRIFGPRTERYKALLDRSQFGELPRTKLGDLSKALIAPKISATPTAAKTTTPVTAKKDNTALLTSAIGQIANALRPSDVEPLDPNQLIGELYALSTNQVEPVWAQKIQPLLSTPVDISLQDILNANQADYNATQRLTGYNPEALSILNAQKYQANQRVLGEQFRLNQAEKQRVYEKNRDILNQTQLQNLGILDQQYVRQQQALSKTKATTQSALNSIAAKYAQNKLENRTLATYENLYNYRFDPRFRAQNFQVAQFNIPTVGTPETLPAKSGKAVKKNYLNSSIVKALKKL